jgi:Uma2 family endonuclease
MEAMLTYTSAEERTRLENVRWCVYVELADQRRGSIPRITFDQGLMEMMNPKRLHEEIGSLIGRVVETYSEVKNIAIKSVASTTFRRPDLNRAFEADEAYYVQNSPLILSKEEIDLSIDPPPDLVIEVEITSSAIRKLELFSSMGVPEVWRHDGRSLTIARLNEGQYIVVQESMCLPGLTASAIDQVLGQRYSVDETTLIRNFRASIR